MALARSALLWASRNRWLATHFPRYRFAQAAVRKFMPGTTVDAALEAAAGLVPKKIAGVFTRLGENITDMQEAQAVVDHYLDVLGRIARRGLPIHISIKLTQLGLDISVDGATQNLAKLAACAKETNNVVWVDMEDSSYVDRTIGVFRDVLARYRNVGLCVQAYLYRTEKDLESLLQDTTAIRLVKGAYNEPASIAFPKKSDTDQNYYELARMMLAATRHIRDTPRPVIGTHDIPLIQRITDAGAKEGISLDDWELHMLYGIRPNEQMRLADAGHRVRCLISYGEQWFPWYVRRLAERPANVWFVVKSMIAG